MKNTISSSGTVYELGFVILINIKIARLTMHIEPGVYVYIYAIGAKSAFYILPSTELNTEKQKTDMIVTCIDLFLIFIFMQVSGSLWY